MEISQHIKVAVDAVVFGYSENKLHVLLIQQKFGSEKGKWALPGGFVKDDESLDKAVVRELKEETGVKANYLEQLYTFGNVLRDRRERVISVAFLALLNPKNYEIKADTDAMDVSWFALDAIPKLAFDHKKIVHTGLERLQSKMNYQPVGFELLKPKFPFSDIENLYSAILKKNVDRRNFRKKLLSFGFLEETDEIYKPSSGRPAKLYQFNYKKYKELEMNGFHFEIKFA